MIGDLVLPGAMFLAGLLGGVTHCAGMCGPFVLGQTTARLAAVPAARMSEFHRLAGAALLPYHAGRATTYALLGTLSASTVGLVIRVAGFGWAAAAMLTIATFVLAIAGLSPLRDLAKALVGNRFWRNRPLAIVSHLAAAPMGWRGYALGVLLGFIPCGLVYGALAAAAATADPVSGALAMAAFALGTAPALVGVGWLGQLAPVAWRGRLARLAPAVLLVNAGMAAWLAWRALAA